MSLESLTVNNEMSLFVHFIHKQVTPVGPVVFGCQYRMPVDCLSCSSNTGKRSTYAVT